MRNMKAIEDFAQKIIRTADADGLTIDELEAAADMAKEISKQSRVKTESILLYSFPSDHIHPPEPLF